MNNKNWVTVKIFSSRSEAEVLGSLLRANGIEFEVFADDVGGTSPAPLSPNPGVKLMVLSSDLDRVSKLL